MIKNATELSVKIMKKSFFIKIFFIYLFIISDGLAKQQNYIEEGIKLYKEKKFNESKVFFERDLVFNPKSEKSYLYLAKIFDKNENKEELEVNLNNVLLINPKNDEAIYMLTILKIEQSDYEKAKELIDQFVLICESFCSKKDEIQEKFEKLNPENAETKN
tara:strand:+ start:116 stop:598 length:483 start_codon:yes stop_codon:yes gene_type:complete